MSMQGRVLVRVELKSGFIRHKFIRLDVMREPNDSRNRVDLCTAFSLDPISCWFELPNSIKTVEANSLVNGRVIDGFVYQGPRDTVPIGKVTVCYESEKFHEHDAEAGGYLRLGK